MPVTAVLSRKFYEKFGEDVSNELVQHGGRYLSG